MATIFRAFHSVSSLRTRIFTIVSQPSKQFVRNLNIHEYQSKILLDRFSINTQRWKLASSPEEAERNATELAAKEFVVKAQIHAGGRGKGVFDNGFQGGVHLCKTASEVRSLCERMLGHSLITKQTPPEGVRVKKVMICESLSFLKEYYFAIVLDRKVQGAVMIVSPQGGMDIESVAKATPHLIFTEPIDPFVGVEPEQTRRLANKLGFKDIAQAQEQMRRLYNLFVNCDATQVEINPFVETVDHKVYCVDAKLNFDDNAAFRRADIFEMQDHAEEDPREVAAHQHGLNYIGMDGDIGCMVNGAGLAMATMDIIKLYHGSPANFLDVGGGANVDQITEAFKIISTDPQVKAILVNIFGGIMKCDVIASGIIEALKQVKVQQPVVVRLAGTNVELGKKMLLESRFSVIPADDLDDAAQKAVASLSSSSKK
jgi:succinyl-CoA synthetase beta subunit